MDMGISQAEGGGQTAQTFTKPSHNHHTIKYNKE